MTTASDIVFRNDTLVRMLIECDVDLIYSLYHLTSVTTAIVVEQLQKVSGDQILYKACCIHSPTLFRLAIGKGANNWNSALCGACEGGHRELAEWLIDDKGATNCTYCDNTRHNFTNNQI